MVALMDKRPCFGLDIDGVIADSVPAFLELFSEILDRPVTMDDITSYSFEESLGIDRGFMISFWKRFTEMGGWQTIEPLDGALDFIHRLRETYDIVLVTGRPPQFVREPTIRWLRDRQIPKPLCSLFRKERSIVTMGREERRSLARSTMLERAPEFTPLPKTVEACGLEPTPG